MPSFLINEIYPCLQGEGPNLGRPSLLIRFQVCNLRCTWCDTSYTHTLKSDPVKIEPGISPEMPSDEKNPKQNFKRYSLEETVCSILSFPMKHLIFSGGEPTLQNFALIKKALPSDYSAEVETNGTRIPHKEFKNFSYEDYCLFQWNVSPKFSNSGEKICKEALSHWSLLSQSHATVFFKFVVREAFFESDVKEILDIKEEFSLPQDKIILMPEGVTKDSQLSSHWLYNFCLQEGFRFTPRLHVILFGAERGV